MTCAGRNWVTSLVISAEVPVTPYIEASTATAGIVVSATVRANRVLIYWVSVCVPALMELAIDVAEDGSRAVRVIARYSFAMVAAEIVTGVPRFQPRTFMLTRSYCETSFTTPGLLVLRNES